MDYRKNNGGHHNFHDMKKWHGPDIRFVLCAASIRGDLSSAKMINSPSDPRNKRRNLKEISDGKLSGGWGAKTHGGSKYCLTGSGSYGHHLMGDDQTPEAILHFTRNVEGDGGGKFAAPSGEIQGGWGNTSRTLKANGKGAFLGAGEKSSYSVSGLDKDTGNWSTSSGAVVQGNGAQWKEAINVTAKQTGGSLSAAHQRVSRDWGND